MKKILIALDYNKSAQEVAEIGYSLAKTMNAEAILFHVITEVADYSAFQYGPVMGFPSYIDPDFRGTNDPTELKNKSLSYLDQIKKHLGDKKIKMEVAEGKAAETILYAANEMKADIIVIGSHSKIWIEKILVGSVTEEVLRDSTIPLFIIPVREK
ncbi:MAG: universal stress protein [Bacteroidota bacterium]|nr:universal stress protein [Bacteroidota bacterium]